MRLTPRLLTTAALSTALASSALAADAITADFDGGTAVEYLHLLTEHDDSLNVMMAAGVSGVEIPPLKLRNVDLSAAIRVIDELSGEYNGAPIKLVVERVPSEHPGEANDIYRISAPVVGPVSRRSQSTDRSRPRSEAMISEVWSLDGVNQRGTSSPEVLAALEAALDMPGESGTEPTLRYHADSNLLLAHASANQMGLISSVIQAFHNKPQMPSQDDEREFELEQTVQKLQSEISTMTNHLNSVKQTASRSRDSNNSLRLKYELLQEHVATLTKRNEALEKRLFDLIERHAHEKAQLEAQLAQARNRDGS